MGRASLGRAVVPALFKHRRTVDIAEDTTAVDPEDNFADVPAEARALICHSAISPGGEGPEAQEADADEAVQRAPDVAEAGPPGAGRGRPGRLRRHRHRRRVARGLGGRPVRHRGRPAPPRRPPRRRPPSRHGPARPGQSPPPQPRAGGGRALTQPKNQPDTDSARQEFPMVSPESVSPESKSSVWCPPDPCPPNPSPTRWVPGLLGCVGGHPHPGDSSRRADGW